MSRRLFKNCTYVLREQGKPYPRTCQECGLGPCKANLQAAKPADALGSLLVVAWIDIERRTVELDSSVCFQTPTVAELGKVPLVELDKHNSEIQTKNSEIAALKEKITKQNVILGMTKLSIADKDRTIENLQAVMLRIDNKLTERITAIEQMDAELTSLRAKLAGVDGLVEAVRNLRKVKGRFHTEQAFTKLMEALATYEAAQAAPCNPADPA